MSELSQAGFAAQWRDFWRFLKHPTTAHRRRVMRMPQSDTPDPPGSEQLIARLMRWIATVQVMRADWRPYAKPAFYLQWLLVTLTITLFVFMPLMFWVSQKTQAVNHLSSLSLPFLFFLALFWAPVVEELCFRFPLRRPQMALWVLPFSVYLVVSGPGLGSIISLAVVVYSMVGIRSVLLRNPSPLNWRLMRFWVRHYPHVCYISMLLFAFVHLRNYQLPDVGAYLLPLLLFPQFFVGALLSWMRVRYGLGTGILFHALYNALWISLSVLN